MITSPSLWARLKDNADNNIFNVVGSGAPTSGTSGTGVGICGPGSTYTDYTNAIIYVNTNTLASPTWTVALTTTGTQTLTNKTLTAPTVTSPLISTGLGTVQGIEATFTETTGAGTYTGSVTVPAGASILDILIAGVALWNAAGACSLKVGDVADDDGYYTAIDLKATDLLAGESLSFALAGGKAGAYIANSQVSPRYSATSRVISGIISAASTGGTTGRTRMTVVYHLPVTADIVAATKV